MQSTAASVANQRVERMERFSASLRRPDVSHVIFDFDGTLSWLRHGWPRIMLSGFLQHAPESWRREPTQSELLADILSLNGKPTIHQMRSFADRMARESVTIGPENLFAEYEANLHRAIAERRNAIEAGASRDDFVVCGARQMLELLRERGVTLIILSGTVETEVRAEAALLGLAEFFGNHIYGSARGVAFSKRNVIERLMREEKIEGHHLLSFGDGPVEIQFTKAAGGLAIGVASDEDVNGSHDCDPFKREQLHRAGADALIPDYAEASALLTEIFRT
ncbi:MAG TPA: HAD family hydrolase [Candidatus Acidoferrum sp.]|nr:HAD family hydrolase [Candidatus Acidoferrum sp.]